MPVSRKSKSMKKSRSYKKNKKSSKTQKHFRKMKGGTGPNHRMVNYSDIPNVPNGEPVNFIENIRQYLDQHFEDIYKYDDDEYETQFLPRKEQIIGNVIRQILSINNNNMTYKIHTIDDLANYFKSITIDPSIPMSPLMKYTILYFRV